MKSILSDIVGKYSRHTENICSESLALILNDSKDLQKAFSEHIKVLSGNSININTEFNILTQVASKNDTSIPDLEIKDKSDRKFLIEAKFWAGLTEHQPNSYLERIQPTGGALIFIAPERRLKSLYIEVRSLLKFKIEDENNNQIELPNSTTILFLSWTSILERLWDSAEYYKDRVSSHNLYQLQSLISKLDSEGFIPFEPSFFTPAAAIQRDQLIDVIIDAVTLSNRLETKGLKDGGGKYHYMKYFKLDGKIGGYIAYSPKTWMKYGETPIYFCISERAWPGAEDDEINLVKEALRRKNIPHTIEDFLMEGYPAISIPLKVPLFVGKHEVLQDLRNQIENIIDLLV